MSVTRNKRALLLVINVQQGVSQGVQWLYQFIDRSGELLTDILGANYGQYRKLVGNNATKAKFLNAVTALGNNTSIKAIDVVVMLHGSDNKLVFADATHNTQQLSAEILALNLRNKLRLLYSTACYGKSHADDFVNAGFSAAVGAKKVNANAAAEVPVLFTAWASGARLRDAVAAGESPLTRLPADAAARWFCQTNSPPPFPCNDVNSDKVIIGDENITIGSNG